MSMNATERVLLTLGSDRKGREDVEISRVRGKSACSREFIRVKSRETNVQRILYLSSFIQCRLRVLVRLTCLCEA